MEKAKYYLLAFGRWLKGRSYLTLAVGAGFGAFFDDWVIGLLKLIF